MASDAKQIFLNELRPRTPGEDYRCAEGLIAVSLEGGIVLSLALAAALLGLSVEALALAAPQVAVATRTSQSPTIDGNLSDPVWVQAVLITDFT